ncbi:hypothetical protein CFIICLFH_4760 [Methylobacterium goesingense]|nr:hypothetical protein CFIICLFH_4760 [Methylobacterium goesingense]
MAVVDELLRPKSAGPALDRLDGTCRDSDEQRPGKA